VTVTPPLEDQYHEAFAMYVAGDRDEHALLAAYDCGRQALADDRGPLDLVAIHHSELVAAARKRSLDEATMQFVASGQEILSHSLMSFEVARRGFVEANVALRDMNAKLESRVAELRSSEAQLNQQAARLRALAEASAAFAEAVPDYERLLETVAACTADATFDGCAVRMLKASWQFEPVAFHHSNAARRQALADAAAWFASSGSGDIWQRLIEHRQVVRLPSSISEQSTLWPAVSEFLRSRAIVDLLAVPLVARGRVLGDIWLVRFDGATESFSVDDEALARSLAYGAALALDNARLYRDATEALHAERIARSEAEAALRERDEFLSVAAHELKTPLAGLRGYVGLAQRASVLDPADPERLTHALNNVDHQTERLGRLVTLLMDATILDLGQLDIDREWTDMYALVERVANEAQARTSRHTVRLGGAAAVKAQVDALRLQQVMANIVDNAIRYSPDGGPIDIVIATTEQGMVRIAVRDYGLGLAPERRQRLFQRFFRGHDDRYASGLGLGLFISREIISRHDGRLFAEFPPEGGTRVVVEIPVGQAPRPSGRSRMSGGVNGEPTEGY
jgi:signal transduction histidine kinase